MEILKMHQKHSYDILIPLPPLPAGTHTTILQDSFMLMPPYF